MKDIKKIQEFFSKPLNEVSGNIDSEDFAKVVQAISQTDHPVTVMLTPMFGKNEIELLIGMNAPDPIGDAMFNIMTDLGYRRGDFSIVGDTSTYSRREYSDIRRVNGGHRDYKRWEESVNELDAATYRSALEKGRSRGDSKGRGIATNALNLLAKQVAQTLVGQSFEVAGSRENLAKGFYRGNSQKFINQFLMTFTGEGRLSNLSKLDTVGGDEAHFRMNVEFQNPDNIGGFSTDVKFRGYEKYKFPGTVQFSIKEGNVWVWYNAADTDLEFTRVGARAIAKLADMVAQELQLKTPVKHNSIKQFDPMKPSVEESKKLTFNDFVRMVRDDMMAGAAPDERPSEELVGKRAKAYYNEYLQGASVDDLFEATKDEETTFHKKLDKLVHDTFGKRKDELEEAADQKQADIYAYEFMQYFDKMRRIVGSNFGDDTRKEFEKLVQNKFSNHTVNETEELTEAYVPSNIAEFAKRRGISSLVRKVAGWAERVGARITGGTAIGKGYDTLILDMGYQTGDIRIDCNYETIELYDEPVESFADFKNVFMEEVTRQQAEHDEEQLRRERGLEEKAAYIAETIKLGLMLNEELCDKGKRYIAARQAAGEKSSAYLSGRAVRVCKGQIEWPKKGKKK